MEATRLAIGVFVFACAVELAQWFRLADVLHLTGWARVVVGTSFSVHDILMYAAECWVDTNSEPRALDLHKKHHTITSER